MTFKTYLRKRSLIFERRRFEKIRRSEVLCFSLAKLFLGYCLAHLTVRGIFIYETISKINVLNAISFRTPSWWRNDRTNTKEHCHSKPSNLYIFIFVRSVFSDSNSLIQNINIIIRILTREKIQTRFYLNRSFSWI